MRVMFLSAAAALVLAACATATGPDAANRFDSYKTVQSTDLRTFERVQVLAPVAGPNVVKRIDARTSSLRRRERPISQRDVNARLAELGSDLTRAVGREAQIVQQGGEGVLTIKTIVTELDANRPTQAEFAAEPSLSFQSIAAGRAAVTIELSENGRVIAVIKDEDNVSGLNDPQLQGVGIWTTANRFFDRVSEKVGALLRS